MADEWAIARQIRREQRLETGLKLGLTLIVLSVVVVMGAMIYSFIADRNAPPKNYFDYQTRLWQAAISQDPTNAAGYEQLGFVYLKAKRYRQAINTFERGLSYNPKQVGILYNLGVAFHESGKDEKAIEKLKTALQYAPTSGKYLAAFQLGEIYEKQGKEDKAVENYKLSVQDNPTIWNTHFALGRMYEKQGQKDPAIKEYQEALKFDPPNEKVKQALKRVQGK